MIILLSLNSLFVVSCYKIYEISWIINFSKSVLLEFRNDKFGVLKQILAIIYSHDYYNYYY